jgi:hypothetical protein
MDLKSLTHMPPWQWPEQAGKALLAVLRDEKAAESDRRLAAELAGDVTVMDDDIARVLISIVENSAMSEGIRGCAAISLGPALEEADLDGFDDADNPPAVTEPTFRRIREFLRQGYADLSMPDEVRRRILEASVRAPQNWHRAAIRTAFARDDEQWQLTAAFCMQFVEGLEDQIEEALHSTNPDIYYAAVVASGNWGVQAAWPHVAALLTSGSTDRSLLLAAIAAAPGFRQGDAAEVLADLLDSDDEEIVSAVEEALAMAKGLSEDDECADAENE